MQTRITIILIFILAGFAIKSNAQNVGINSTGAAPDASAGLDVNFTDKGFLTPRMTLAQKLAISSPATGLLVYQTDGVTGFYYNSGTPVSPAWVYNGSISKWTTSGANIYYASGKVGIGSTSTPNYALTVGATANPLFLSGVQEGSGLDSILLIAGGVVKKRVYTATASTNAWSLTGNGGQTSTSTTGSYLGTSDSNPLRFRTNATERMTIDPTGKVGIGIGTPTENLHVNGNALLTGQITSSGTGESSIMGNLGIGDVGYPESKLTVVAGLIDSDLSLGLGTVAYVEGERNQFMEINITNTSAGLDASADITATNDNGSDSTGYINMGINSSGYRSNLGSGRILNGPDKAYLYSTGSELYIGNATNAKPIVFFTNNSGYATTEDARGTERMRLLADGDLLIGRTTDAGNYKLQVNGDVLIDDLFYDTATQTSDRRLKTNISGLNYGLKEVLKLRPVTYNWKKTPDTNKQVGLIAQEVREVIPEIVKGDETKETIGMDYISLVPVLINAIKELKEEINKQNEEINALKALSQTSVTAKN